MSNEFAFVRLQQLISPSLPIGSFTYSQGMEWAVECGWLRCADEVQQWIGSLMQDALQWQELPVLQRLYQACVDADKAAFQYYSAWAVAGRETAELRQEEQQRAKALLRVFNQLPDISQWHLYQPWQASLTQSPLSGFAMACYYWKIPLRQALSGYLWSWLENMVSVAVKLIPLGQSDGQRILYRLSENIDALCEQATEVTDDDLGACSPALAIASSLHETQYCRLFRS